MHSKAQTVRILAHFAKDGKTDIIRSMCAKYIRELTDHPSEDLLREANILIEELRKKNTEE
jgi:hypothetical protein